jgi:hypothetical protein
MANIGMTLFELQARDQLARQAQLRQQEQEQSAANVLQEQVGWDRAFKERDQLVAHQDKKEGRALDWAKLKGQASGITGTPLEQFETPDEQSQAEAYRQYEGADRGYNQNMKRMAEEAAWAQLGYKENQSNYRAGLISADRAASLSSREETGRLNREQNLNIANNRLQLGYHNSGLQDEDRDAGRAQAYEIFGVKDVAAGAKTLGARSGVQQHLETLAEAMSKSDDIAGVGLLAGQVPDRFTRFISGEDAPRYRAAAKSLVAELLKANSGLTSTQQEQVRTIEAMMMAPNRADQDFILGIRQLMKYEKQARVSLEAGIRPETLQTLRGRGMPSSINVPNIRPPMYIEDDEDNE